jgi:hypothetical protein
VDFVYVRHEEYRAFAAVADTGLTGIVHLINGLLDAREHACSRSLDQTPPVTMMRRFERSMS